MFFLFLFNGSLRNQLSRNVLDRSSPGLVDLRVQMIDQTYSFSDRSKDVATVTNFVAELAKLAYFTFIHVTVFQNRLEYPNAGVKRLNGGNPSTSGRNLVSFHPVTQKFTTLECVQQASISNRVSFTTFARGQHC